MRKNISATERLLRNEQPIAWGRAFIVGAFSSLVMMGFIDIFAMLGISHFSYEVYLGSLFTWQNYETHNWTIGLPVNIFLGGVFGILYAYFFEYFYKRSGTRNGLLLGLAHSGIAAVAFFPFFQAIRGQMGLELYRDFGFFGTGMSEGLPFLLIVGHLLFGATMGTLYGPVRLARLHAHLSEPGETLDFGHPGLITSRDDPEDQITRVI